MEVEEVSKYCSAYRMRHSGPLLTADSSSEQLKNGFSDHFWVMRPEITLPKSVISSKWGQDTETQRLYLPALLSWKRQRLSLHTPTRARKQPKSNVLNSSRAEWLAVSRTRLGSQSICTFVSIPFKGEIPKNESWGMVLWPLRKHIRAERRKRKSCSIPNASTLSLPKNKSEVCG